MAIDPVNDRISIKNILFTKAMPNYKIPIPTDGHKLYACTDCSDKFIFESSYMMHINRKSLQITYYCRYCSKLNVFFNRCQFLSHIRSHFLKTATINLSDLKIEPLPLENTDASSLSPAATHNTSQNAQHSTGAKRSDINCYECKKNITSSMDIEKDRVKHYMDHSNRVFTCPVCLFTLPTTCALSAHIRIHLQSSPFICPECGKQLFNKTCFYPYSHDCEGFKMIRVTARIKCFKLECPLLHPNNYIPHMRLCHFNKIFKCPNCTLAGYNENAVLKHVMRCCDKTKYPTYYECQQCPGIFLSANQINKHLDMHVSNIHKNEQLYPCWSCGIVMNNAYDLLEHHVKKHNTANNIKPVTKILQKVIIQICSECSKNMFRWTGINLASLSSKCPKCLLKSSTNSARIDIPKSNQHQIVCHFCQVKVNENWEEIKIHFREFHKNIKCLDLNLNLQRISLSNIKERRTMQKQSKIHKITKNKKIKSTLKLKLNKAIPTVPSTDKVYACKKCNFTTEDYDAFQLHIKCHSEPAMAYQCMECGECFAVKPSFSTHLRLEHEINDVNDYIERTNCFNKEALEKYHIGKPDNDEEKPLEENQCNICREKFEDPNSLEKHYRVHGMAFLKKNTQKSKSP